MSELREVLQVNQHQISELSRHLETFVAIRDKATTVLPEIQNKMAEVGELLKSGAANVSASLEQTSQQILLNADSMRVAWMKVPKDSDNRLPKHNKHLPRWHMMSAIPPKP